MASSKDTSCLSALHIFLDLPAIADELEARPSVIAGLSRIAGARVKGRQRCHSQENYITRAEEGPFRLLFGIFPRTASTPLGLIADRPGEIGISILPRMVPCPHSCLFSSFFTPRCDLRLNIPTIPFRGLRIGLFQASKTPHKSYFDENPKFFFSPMPRASQDFTQQRQAGHEEVYRGTYQMSCSVYQRIESRGVAVRPRLPPKLPPKRWESPRGQVCAVPNYQALAQFEGFIALIEFAYHKRNSGRDHAPRAQSPFP